MEKEVFNKKNNQLKSLLETGDFTVLKQGAEARLYHGLFENNKVIIKERFSKKYRIPELDKSLNKKRTKHEEKLLNKASSLCIKVPKVYKTDLDNGIIIMEYIQNSLTGRDFFLNLAKSEKSQEEKNIILSKLTCDIGKIIGRLHSNQIIHGDLTTSNIIIIDDESGSNNSSDSLLYFIDFGLSFISSQSEDKAVDLYVLERALLSTHSLQAKFMFENILSGYSLEYKTNYDDVLDRLNQVRLRGNFSTSFIIKNAFKNLTL
jgi:TP53 regulating kinase-like protein